MSLKECNSCGSHNHITENCPYDGKMRHPSVHVWKSIVVEDLDVLPIEITSKRQYKEELKKRGLECRGLM